MFETFWKFVLNENHFKCIVGIFSQSINNIKIKWNFQISSASLIFGTTFVMNF